jgi:hypothetical protein
MTQGADEEAACRGGVPLLGQQHLDDLPELVDRPVQVPPPTGGLDVGLIDKPPVPGRMPKWPGIGEQREPLHQPVHRDVVDLDAELGQQLLDVPVGQPIAEVPADRDGDHLGWETGTRQTPTGRRGDGRAEVDAPAQLPQPDRPPTGRARSMQQTRYASPKPSPNSPMPCE